MAKRKKAPAEPMKRRTPELIEIDKRIGANLRAIRMQIGFTQESLAKGLGVTFQQVQKYEKGTNRISGSRIFQFCKLLKCSPNTLLAWTGSDKPAEGLSGYSAVAFKMAKAIDGLPDDYRGIAAAVIRVMQRESGITAEAE